MNIKMFQYGCPFGVLIFFTVFLISCEKENLRTNQHKEDLFADQRREGKAYVMNVDECFDASDMVLSTSDIKLVDSSSGRGRPIFIYRLKTGRIEKTTRDSVIVYPFQFLSGQRLKLKKDSMYIFLKKLDGYRFIAQEKKLKYQWLKAAPVYSLGEDSK